MLLPAFGSCNAHSQCQPACTTTSQGAMAFMMAPTSFQNLVVVQPQCMQTQGMQPPQQHQSMLLLAPTSQPLQHFPQLQVSTAGSVDLYSAVESLYRNGLKPYGRILRKRLAEQAQAMIGLGSSEPDITSLRAAC